MKRSFTTARLPILFAALLACTVATAGGLDSFLEELDVRATADLGSYKADLSLTYDISEKKLEGLFEVTAKASDVYMCLRIGELARQPVDRVVEEYRKSGGQGWGVIAKNLGIKPGSDEFHALKAGRLPGQGEMASTSKKGNSGNKGKGHK